MPDGRNPPTTVAFLLIREFPMLSVVSGVEPLRGANRLLAKRCYDWRFYSDDGAPVTASNGMTVNVSGGLAGIAANLDGIDYLFVTAGLDADPPNRARLHAVLHQCARSRMVIGSLSSGTFILARAGLLDGYRCTIHWEFRPAFVEAFPELDCSPGLYVIDRDRWTGSGGVACMDMMLQLIERDHGPALS
ncbi:MAG: AraC family transcriptional regulator, partial [Proteobacteria bacterium]|nr:AraC family transcriptional regulator [Pseudomonadota bacterium]